MHHIIEFNTTYIYIPYYHTFPLKMMIYTHIHIYPIFCMYISPFSLNSSLAIIKSLPLYLKMQLTFPLISCAIRVIFVFINVLYLYKIHKYKCRHVIQRHFLLLILFYKQERNSKKYSAILVSSTYIIYSFEDRIPLDLAAYSKLLLF